MSRRSAPPPIRRACPAAGRSARSRSNTDAYNPIPQRVADLVCHARSHLSQRRQSLAAGQFRFFSCSSRATGNPPPVPRTIASTARSRRYKRAGSQPGPLRPPSAPSSLPKSARSRCRSRRRHYEASSSRPAPGSPLAPHAIRRHRLARRVRRPQCVACHPLPYGQQPRVTLVALDQPPQPTRASSTSPSASVFAEATGCREMPPSPVAPASPTRDPRHSVESFCRSASSASKAECHPLSPNDAVDPRGLQPCEQCRLFPQQPQGPLPAAPAAIVATPPSPRSSLPLEEFGFPNHSKYFFQSPRGCGDAGSRTRCPASRPQPPAHAPGRPRSHATRP